MQHVPAWIWWIEAFAWTATFALAAWAFLL